jgi:hypothetical protein
MLVNCKQFFWSALQFLFFLKFDCQKTIFLGRAVVYLFESRRFVVSTLNCADVLLLGKGVDVLKFKVSFFFLGFAGTVYCTVYQEAYTIVSCYFYYYYYDMTMIKYYCIVYFSIYCCFIFPHGHSTEQSFLPFNPLFSYIQNAHCRQTII